MAEIPPPIFDGDDVEELAAWISETMAADPAIAAMVGAGKLAATEYARRRAAQLLGMSWNGGQWVPAKRAAYRIADDLRTKVQEIVTGVIERGDAVSTLNAELRPLFEEITGRASMIARTETAMALNAGSLAGYSELGVEAVDVIDGPGCLPYGHDDAAPEPDPDVIGVQEDRQAHGQVWPVDVAAEYLTGHPHCVRVLSPRQAA